MTTIIETERLILRTWQIEDIEPFALINKDPNVMKYMPSVLTNQESEEFIKKMVLHYNQHGFGPMALTLKNTGVLIGYLGLKNVEIESHFSPNIEIAWRIASEHWNKGYATEGAKACIDYGFHILGFFHEIVSFTVPANLASIKVMEKIGMTRDLKGDFAHPKLPLDHPLSKHVLYRINHSH